MKYQSPNANDCVAYKLNGNKLAYNPMMPNRNHVTLIVLLYVHPANAIIGCQVRSVWNITGINLLQGFRN